MGREGEGGGFEPALAAQADAAAVRMFVRTIPSTNCEEESEGSVLLQVIANKKIRVNILLEH